LLAVAPSATPPKLTVFGDAWSELVLVAAAPPIIAPPRQPHNVKVRLQEKKTKMKK
jgi:hypothetical protein